MVEMTKLSPIVGKKRNLLAVLLLLPGMKPAVEEQKTALKGRHLSHVDCVIKSNVGNGEGLSFTRVFLVRLRKTTSK